MSVDVRIAMQYKVSPSIWGGMDEFICALNARLSARGIRMEVVVPRFHETDISRYEGLSIPCRVLRGGGFFDALVEDCKRAPVKVLHTHFLPTLSAKYRRFKGAANAIISTEHMSRPIDGWSIRKKVRAKATSLVGRHFVDKLVHVSRYMESENLKFFGERLRGQSSVIYNGVSIEPLDRMYAEECGPHRPIRLVSVGRLVEEKRFDDVIDVAARITQAHGAVLTLDILGDGPERGKLEAKAGSALNQTIFFRGSVNDVRVRLREADLYVHASSQEAFSFALLEAGEAGLPAVVYGVGGNSEVIRSGFNGEVCAAGSRDQLAQAVMKYIHCPADLERHGINARREIETYFSLESMVDQYVQVYEECLQ